MEFYFKFVINCIFNFLVVFFVLQFFYLVNLEITFSIWFFYVISKVQEGVFTTIGISSTETLSAYEYSQPADLTHQATGAVVVEGI